ncbi:nitrate reductase subunit beta [Acidianus ambivalens]|uniref:Nitrate reductase subunit beta n=1 Tax=Acidianus ambivalens TaxID=2283 RepID=A0A650CWG5_ACIAM|nr:nitrate reductase subunit beta [Acidianus ambivalens]MQL54296.1 nitrate reductase subunit beta [Acidianus ambivalens]QGR22123.1 nitrate reductase subunit beta [Acidianus ambivalens]
MKVMVQFAAVFNLDKCLGCHACSIACKNLWTNREGTEYMWWNNVETKPGPGYPNQWEDQDKWHGGWILTKDGKLKLAIGGRIARLLELFSNPYLPTIDDYYEPFTYTYSDLVKQDDGKQPVAKPISLISKKPIEIDKGPNWNDDLAGGTETILQDPNVKKLQDKIKTDFENAFMMYLPRICNHCLNPSCMAACPAGAIYKRVEDGIVLTDQQKCRGWRFCIAACPYKKVYYNWSTGKAEKCILCYPRIENGQPPACFQQCVGRIRYIGPVFYDADRVLWAVSAGDPKEIIDRHLEIILDPYDPDVVKNAKENGIDEDFIKTAQRTPVYKMMKVWRIALPLHPEYRTLPMVWYIPPLSPIVENMKISDEQIFPLVDQMRIPLEYLASLFTAGDVDRVKNVLKKLLALRIYQRYIRLHKNPPGWIFKETSLTEKDFEEMYKVLAIAKIEDRFVIPTAHKEKAIKMFEEEIAPEYGQGHRGMEIAAKKPRDLRLRA